MTDFFTGGKLGEFFAALSFAAALIATLSFFLADRSKPESKTSWGNIGKIAFWGHALGVFGVAGTLFYLIYTHQYQYHYVWSHSSNELPVHFMISCFWEGQEGSFLLWSFWHSILGLVLVARGGEWRNGIMAIIASVEMILSSMILGVYLNEAVVTILYSLAAIAPAAFLLYKWIQLKKEGSGKGIFHLFGIVSGLLISGIVLTQTSGIGATLAFAFTGFFGLATLSLLVFRAEKSALNKGNSKKGNWLSFLYAEKIPLSGLEILTGLIIVALAIPLLSYEPTAWKIGSTPFMLLKTAMPSAPVFGLNPDFIPGNGTGLNPLLQNYWMVIHPPVLFLGFALTVVPFAFVITGLISGKYQEWLKPATPWMIFGVMILGIGIIMGGYWAYETLSFGGYWNWDPVENASLVPWLIGIGSVHTALAYRHSQTFLKLTMVMVILTFLLVLYSTFLTRSGILGDTSVHTFTDLGLTGQLLVLLLFYFGSVGVLFLYRLSEIPEKRSEISLTSREFFLFLATLIFIFSGLGISISTSIPVINKIFGTQLAPPAEVQLFYFRWNVWFAILIGVFSGMGQFIYWQNVKKSDLSKALFRPFLAAIVSASVVIILLAIYKWEFVYDTVYSGWLEVAKSNAALSQKISNYFQFGIYVFADEILLASALFTVFANADIFVQLVRKNKRALKVTGGSLAHIGFGLMLVGILFSSGYDSVISRNFNPEELAQFRAEDRADNVLLLKGRSRYIPGYDITYIGKKEAKSPISNLEIIEETTENIKLKFKDASGDFFAEEFPRLPFLGKGGKAIDLEKVKKYLDENVEVIRPKHINNRSLYGLRFIKAEIREGKVYVDSTDQFTLFPEAEINEGMGLIAHPNRKIFFDRDLYVHISSIPLEEKEEPKFEIEDVVIKMGDTVETKSGTFRVLQVKPLEISEGEELHIEAEIEIVKNGLSYRIKPDYRILTGGKVQPGTDLSLDLNAVVAFTEVSPSEQTLSFVIQQQTNAPEDFVVVKAIKKPFINLLWLGTFILVAGFGIAIYRRTSKTE